MAEIPEPPDSLLDIPENRFERDRLRTAWRMGYAEGAAAGVQAGREAERDRILKAILAVRDAWWRQPGLTREADRLDVLMDEVARGDNQEPEPRDLGGQQ